jgi:hypothetical protein
MKIQKCNMAVVPKVTAKLTYSEMCSEEGVYKQYGGVTSARFIVLKHDGQTLVLHSNGEELQPAVRSWNNAHYSFEKLTNTTVCFEIKEG